MKTATLTTPADVICQNLWHRPDSAYSQRQFVYRGKCLFEHRGVKIYKNPAGSWDCTFNGVTITQRAGFHKETAAELIDGILDGTAVMPVADAVANHLRAAGHTPKAYSDPEGRS
jgi:hypothetical protein